MEYWIITFEILINYSGMRKLTGNLTHICFLCVSDGDILYMYKNKKKCVFFCNKKKLTKAKQHCKNNSSAEMN